MLRNSSSGLIVFGRRTNRVDGSGRAAPGDRMPEIAHLEEDSELAASFASVIDELSLETCQMLVSRMKVVVSRRVPVRSVEAAPAFGAVRVRFGDGTSVLVSGDSPGAVAILGLAVKRGSVIARCEADATGPRLDFSWEGRRRPLSAHIVGFDQPD